MEPVVTCAAAPGGNTRRAQLQELVFPDFFRVVCRGKTACRGAQRLFCEWLRDPLSGRGARIGSAGPSGFSRVDFVPLQDEGTAKTVRREGAKMPQSAAPPSRAAAPKPPRSYNGFNPRYTFDRFVIGSGNRFAHAAARAVADSPRPGLQPPVPVRRHRTGQDPLDAGGRPALDAARSLGPSGIHFFGTLHQPVDSEHRGQVHTAIPGQISQSRCIAHRRYPFHRG